MRLTWEFSQSSAIYYFNQNNKTVYEIIKISTYVNWALFSANTANKCNDLKSFNEILQNYIEIKSVMCKCAMHGRLFMTVRKLDFVMCR